MIVQYIVQAPGHDILLTKEDLSLPFKITPAQDHPFLKLGDYFGSIRSFVLEEKRDSFLSILSDLLGSDISGNNIEKVLIRSEKHGAFHHVASIELLTGLGSVKFALATFLSSNKEWFEREAHNLNELGNKAGPLHFLPKVYLCGHHTVVKNHQIETLFFILMEWLHGFHEWHLSPDPKAEEDRIVIWDQDQGHRRATGVEAQEIFRLVPYILTICFDTEDYRRIYLWQNAAGDFVVRTSATSTEVMLTTVRDYSQILTSNQCARLQPLMAMTFFFLELVTLIRLDREEGVGNLIWCGDWCLEPALNGFFEALQEKVFRKELPCEAYPEFLALLKSFTPQEFSGLLEHTISSLQHIDPNEVNCLTSKISQHAEELHHVIQKFQL